ncbi:MAG: very short patch repair endonuclease [Planctomycetes bacterium]|nr:very short patch repair endonuclease [Planctomycetota bacterium]
MRISKWKTDPATSRRMRMVRRRGTAPERRAEQALRTLRVRYRRNAATLPGTPDFAGVRHRWVVMVHGCFWHAHDGCARATHPTRNGDAWSSKLCANRRRDRLVRASLRRLGFAVLTVWECETLNAPLMIRRLGAFLTRTGVPIGSRSPVPARESKTLPTLDCRADLRTSLDSPEPEGRVPGSASERAGRLARTKPADQEASARRSAAPVPLLGVSLFVGGGIGDLSLRSAGLKCSVLRSCFLTGPLYTKPIFLKRGCVLVTFAS